MGQSARPPAAQGYADLFHRSAFSADEYFRQRLNARGCLMLRRNRVSAANAAGNGGVNVRHQPDHRSDLHEKVERIIAENVLDPENSADAEMLFEDCRAHAVVQRQLAFFRCRKGVIVPEVRTVEVEIFPACAQGESKALRLFSHSFPLSPMGLP